MSALQIATSLSGVDAHNGEQISARRAAIGMSVAALAKRAGVDRGSLTALEDGRSVRDTTVAAVEIALSELEHELGMDVPTQVAEPSAPVAPQVIRFEVQGVYGAKALIVEGPVANLPELEAAVDRIMRRLQKPDAPTKE